MFIDACDGLKEKTYHKGKEHFSFIEEGEKFQVNGAGIPDVCAFGTATKNRRYVGH